MGAVCPRLITVGLIEGLLLIGLLVPIGLFFVRLLIAKGAVGLLLGGLALLVGAVSLGGEVLICGVLLNAAAAVFIVVCHCEIPFHAYI